MPLAFSEVDLPFASGLQQKADPRLVQLGAQTTLVNVSADKQGAFRKRYGSTAVSKQSITASGNGPMLTAGVAVESYKSAPVVSDGSSLYTYSASKNALVYADQVPECIATRTAIAQSTSGIVQMDAAATNGYEAIVYRASDVSGATKNYVTIVDLANDAQIGADTILDTSTKAGLRVVAVGTDFWAIWTDSAGRIVGSRFQTASTFAWIAPIVLASDQSATATFSAWDACPISGGSGFAIIYQDNGAPNHVHVRSFDQNAAPLAQTSFAIGSGVLPITASCIRSTAGETCWVTYSTTDAINTNYIRAIGLDPMTLATTVADTLLWTDSLLGGRHLGVERVNATTCVVVSSGAADVRWQQFNTSAATVGPLRVQFGYQQFSKPFAVGSQVFCLLLHYNDAINQTYQLVDLNIADTSIDNAVGRPVATVAPREAGPMSSQIAVANVANLGNGQYVTPVSVLTSLSRTGVYSAMFDFTSPQRHQGVELGDSLYLAGGVPCVFDGAQVTEHGFLASPILGTIAVNASGSVDVGEHQYAVVYKWPNARGELVRSEPVFSGQVTTTTGNQTVSIQVSALTMTTKQDQGNFWTPAITFDLYRNTIVDPATFWQVAADASEVTNDPRTGTAMITLTDTISDASLEGNAFGLLYTLGGVLTSQCPPSLTCLTVHKNRLFGVGDDPTVIWYTQQFTTGFQPAFNDQLTIACADGGWCSGLAPLDDALIIFKRDCIFQMLGTGPNNTGQQNDFSNPIRISSDVGCTQPRSIVSSPQGVWFLSGKGLCLLARGGEVQYVGAAVEDAVRANPICFAADIVAPLNELRWCLAPSLTSTTGVVVTFNYSNNVWSLSQYYDTDQTVASAVVRGAKAPGGNWIWLGAGGQLSIESSGTFTDNGHWVTAQIATAWLKANGILGWARFHRLNAQLQQVSPFSLVMDYGVDYSDTFQPGVTWNDTQMAAATDPIFALSLMPSWQKASAIRARFTDAPPSVAAVGSGAGAIFIGASAQVGQLPGGRGARLQGIQRG